MAVTFDSDLAKETSQSAWTDGRRSSKQTISAVGAEFSVRRDGAGAQHDTSVVNSSDKQTNTKHPIFLRAADA